jgi:hypothetical protein
MILFFSQQEKTVREIKSGYTSPLVFYMYSYSFQLHNSCFHTKVDIDTQAAVITQTPGIPLRMRASECEQLFF